jgi:hypothetical protein
MLLHGEQSRQYHKDQHEISLLLRRSINFFHGGLNGFNLKVSAVN